MRTTYHLVPDEVWAGTDPDAAYRAQSLAAEGFTHCTDGAEALVATANRHYRSDPRSFVALSIDLDASGVPWTVEDPAGIYPHVFGPIQRAAVLSVERLARDDDGAFTGLQPLAPVPGPTGD